MPNKKQQLQQQQQRDARAGSAERAFLPDGRRLLQKPSPGRAGPRGIHRRPVGRAEQHPLRISAVGSSASVCLTDSSAWLYTRSGGGDGGGGDDGRVGSVGGGFGCCNVLPCLVEGALGTAKKTSGSHWRTVVSNIYRMMCKILHVKCYV